MWKRERGHLLQCFMEVTGGSAVRSRAEVNSSITFQDIPRFLYSSSRVL